MLAKSNTMKIQKKTKNKSLLKTQRTTIKIPSKKQINLPSTKEKKESFKLIAKNSHSISSKEDIKRKINKNINNNKILNNNYNNQVLGTSNCVLPTNYTDKEEEKKRVLSKDFNIREEKNLRHLGDLFRKSNLKKTIIIDDEGNNNLNLNKNIFLDSKDHRINFNKFKNNINAFRHDTKNIVNENNKIRKKTHNKVISNNIVPSSLKLKEIKFRKENDERLNEYGFFFNLLNTNIEEMKDMFRKSPLKIENKENYINDNIKTKKKNYLNNKKYNRNNKNIQIFSEEDKEEINKIQPYDLEKKDINNISNNDNINNNKENSFFESCFQEDFYKNFVDENQVPQVNISNCSFDFSSVISDKSSSIIINTNSDKTQCEIDENLNNNNNVIHNFDINPHTLISKKKENKTLKKYKGGSKSTSHLNLSNEKCCVF